MCEFVAHKSGLKFSKEIVCYPVEESGENEPDWRGSVTLDGSELDVDSICCQLKSSLTPREAAGVLGVSSRCHLSKGDTRKLKVKIYDQKAFDTKFFLFIDKKPVQLRIKMLSPLSEHQIVEDTELAVLVAPRRNRGRWAMFVALIAAALVTTQAQTGWFSFIRTELVGLFKVAFWERFCEPQIKWKF